MLPPLPAMLGFTCDNTAYRPVMDAMKLLKRYAGVDGKTRLYEAVDTVPMDGVVLRREAVVDDKGRIERIPYELCALVALRDAARRREIHVEGAARRRTPEDDLPGGFEATRAVHYAAIRRPLDPGVFIADPKKRMASGLDQLSGALADGSSGGVKVTTRKGEPWMAVPKLAPLDEPTGLAALKEEVARRRTPTSSPASPRSSPRWPRTSASAARGRAATRRARRTRRSSRFESRSSNFMTEYHDRGNRIRRKGAAVAGSSSGWTSCSVATGVRRLFPLDRREVYGASSVEVASLAGLLLFGSTTGVRGRGGRQVGRRCGDRA
ncbi:hypothetical protein ACFRCG_02920 [Embleya sp. NPDC056575]|uniref:hypothetical protein n=1 Tax=unclassified Embleya TaxID=2699296 RepID=UPI0036BE3325